MSNDNVDFNIREIYFPNACSNCIFCHKGYLAGYKTCYLNSFVSQFIRSIRSAIDAPNSTTCSNFMPDKEIKTLLSFKTIEEFNINYDLGYFDAMPRFVVEMVKNGLADKKDATYKQISFTTAIASATESIPPLKLMNDATVPKIFIPDIQIVEDKKMLQKYISENIDTWRNTRKQ